MQDKLRKEICRLDSIADLWYKGQPFRKTDIINNGAYPCIHYGELFSKYGAIIDSVVSRCNTSPKRLSQTGDILFPASDVTPAGLARCSVILQDNVILGGDIIGLRPQRGLNPVYLSYAIRHQRGQLLQRVTGTLIKHISAKSLHSVLIPVHCIERQNLFEKQVRLLSSIIDHRHAQLTALDEIVKCRFVEVFANSLLNERHWPVMRMGDVAPSSTYTGMISSMDNLYWLLNLDMVESNTGRIIDKIFVSIDEIGQSTTSFSKEYVLFSKLRPYLNKVVIPDNSGYATTELVPLLPEPSLLNQVFLAQLLRGNEFLSFISTQVSGTKMPRVIMKVFWDFKVMLPPLPLQEQFATFVDRVDKLRFVSTPYQINDPWIGRNMGEPTLW